MRRGSWFRPLAVVIELWLVAVLLGHGTIYTCPEHDGAPPATASHGVSVAGHQHDASSVADPRGSSAADDQGPHHCGCLCPGDCAGGASSWLLTRTGVPTPPVPGRVSLRVPRAIVALGSRHDHLLPFSNGPPTPLSA